MYSIRYLMRVSLMLFLLLSGSLAGTALAQSRTISGKITDAANSTGIPGVNILQKGTTVGTTTDAEGNFQLTVSANAKTLVISSVGYQAREIPITNSNTIDLSLETDTRSLNEVVVVGYGQKTTRKLTESIGTVQAKDITRLPVANAEAAI